MPTSRRTLLVTLLAATLAAALSAFLAHGPAAVAADESPNPGNGDAATFEVYRDRRGEYRWRLRAQNKQILATSGEGYTDKRDCMAAIESVKRVAADAPVEEAAVEAPAGKDKAPPKQG